MLGYNLIGSGIKHQFDIDMSEILSGIKKLYIILMSSCIEMLRIYALNGRG